MPPAWAGPLSLTLATSAPCGLSSPRLSAISSVTRLDAHAEPAAVHSMIGLSDQLGHDRLGQVGRDREADADRDAGRRIDRRVDADDLAVHVEHRAPGIAPVDRGVGLQEIVVGSRIDVALPRRQDAGGDAAAEAERIADRQHPIADPRLVAVAPGHRGSCLSVFTFKTATSVLVSRPTSSALRLVSSCRMTVISSASAMT